jgi:predicted transposase YbfD/YdcC
VDAKSNEIPAARTLLAGLELTGVTVTMDAMHTVRHEVARERVATQDGRWLMMSAG